MHEGKKWLSWFTTALKEVLEIVDKLTERYLSISPNAFPLKEEKRQFPHCSNWEFQTIPRMLRSAAGRCRAHLQENSPLFFAPNFTVGKSPLVAQWQTLLFSKCKRWRQISDRTAIENFIRWKLDKAKMEKNHKSNWNENAFCWGSNRPGMWCKKWGGKWVIGRWFLGQIVGRGKGIKQIWKANGGGERDLSQWEKIMWRQEEGEIVRE